ncbi:hypothetical protein V6N12_063181 [Hibiscus sabdariffa]|uniref:CCHC-type domain-containing protein n=1 Tax=Hibiscus sabdariffa TaxID=183260 RepID=A0ABR2FB36_9ROSI
MVVQANLAASQGAVSQGAVSQASSGVSSVSSGSVVSQNSEVSGQGYTRGSRGGSSYRGRGRGRFNNRPQCQLCGRIGHVVQKCYYRFGLSYQGQTHEDGAGKQQDSAVQYVQCSEAPAPISAQLYNHVFQPVSQQVSVQQQSHGFSQYGQGHNFPHHQQFSYFPAQGGNSMSGFFSPMVPVSAAPGGYSNVSTAAPVVVHSAPGSSSGGFGSQGTPSTAQVSFSTPSTPGFGSHSSATMNTNPCDTVCSTRDSTNVPVIQTITSLDDLLVKRQCSSPNTHEPSQQRDVSVEVSGLNGSDRAVCAENSRSMQAENSQSVQVPPQEETVCMSRGIGVEDMCSSEVHSSSEGQTGLAAGCDEEGFPNTFSEGSETHEGFNEVSETGGFFFEGDTGVEPVVELAGGQGSGSDVEPVTGVASSGVAVDKTVNVHPMVTRGKSLLHVFNVVEDENCKGNVRI